MTDIVERLRICATGPGDTHTVVICRLTRDTARDAADEIERLRAQRDAALAAKEPGRRWRHVERGTEYAEVGRVTLQAATGPAAEGDTLVIYRGADGRLWAREAHEFEDGRFVPAKKPGRD